jgi:hypothetical protein
LPLAFVVFMAVLFWCGVFMIFFAAQGTTPWDFFLGGFEPPPSHIGTWVESGVDGTSGLVREERFLFPQGDENASVLLHQVRYRNSETQEIVRVEPERRVRRRRVRSR